MANGQLSVLCITTTVALASLAVLPLPAEVSPSPDQKILLEQRDRFLEEARKLVTEGRIDEAIGPVSGALGIQRKISGDVSEPVAEYLEQLAAYYLHQNNFESARQMRQEILEIKRKLKGPEHWQVTDARLALENVQWLAGLLDDQRRELAEAERLRGQLIGLHSQGKYEQAVTAGQREAEIRKQVQGEKHRDYATSVTNLAVLYESLGDYERAEPLFRQAMEIWEEVLGTRHPSYAASLNNLGFLYDSRGDYARAEPLLRDAIEILRELLGERHPDYASSLNNLASVYQKMGQYARAETLFQQALDIRKELFGERHPSYAETLNNLALLYRLMGEYRRAEPLYLQALDIRKEALGMRHPLYAQSLSNLAVLYESIGDYTRAEPLYVEAIAIRKEMLGEHHPAYATSLNNLAVMYRSMGQYPRAEPLYRQALEVRKAVLGESHPHYAQSLNNLAGLYHSVADYARAEPLYRKALEIRKAALGEHHPDYADSLFVLGELYWSMGDPERAEPMFREAMQVLAESVGEHHHDYGVSMNNLALIYLTHEDHARAEARLKQALEITRKSLGEHHHACATMLNNLAGLYWSLGDGARAEPLFREALEIRRKSLGARHPELAFGLINLASLYESHLEYSRAEPLYRQAVEITKESLGERHPTYAAALNGLSFLHQATGNHGRAEELCREAASITIQLVEETLGIGSEHQQLRLAAEHHAQVEHMVSIVLDSRTDDVARLHDLLLRWKGLIAGGRHEQFAGGTNNPEIAQRVDELRQVRQLLATMAYAIPPAEQIDVWRRRLEEARQRKDNLESELAGLSREFGAKLELRRLTGTDLSKVLPDGTCLIDILEYRHVWPASDGKGDRKSERRIIAFVIHPNKAGALVQLGAAGKIHEAIGKWRQAASNVDPDKLQTAGRQLREMVWEPVEQHLAGARHVCVSPDGMLAQLPLAALPGRRDGAYVLEEYAVSYVDSAHDLVQMLQTKSSPDASGSGLLAVGDVDYEDRDEQAVPLGTVLATRSLNVGPQVRAGFLPLPGTGLEIERGRALYQASFADARVEALTRQDASEPLVKRALEGGWQVAHLATHGFFESPSQLRNQLRAAPQAAGSTAATLRTAELATGVAALVPLLKSGLVLAGAAAQPPELSASQLISGEIPDDGILTAEEVASLDMRGTELVTLSACDTGLGELTAGQGVMGLARAFHRAGVQTVVSSLWKVDDAATSVLMEEFYTNLWVKKLPKLQALRQAQITVLNHPERIEQQRKQLEAELASRGLTGRIQQLPDGGTRAEPDVEAKQRSHPAYWAAFVLSGDPE